MFVHRGRGGPRRPTPANIQCQKCLKRGHYSYECKTPVQERPYVPRPSRTQQLRNPSLMPKLANDSLSATERRQGLADSELAKGNPERAKSRGGAPQEDELGNPSRNQRSPSTSPSAHSVSTISTSGSASPPEQRWHHQQRNRSIGANSQSSPRDRSRSRSQTLSKSPLEGEGRACSPSRVHGRNFDRSTTRSPNHHLGSRQEADRRGNSKIHNPPISTSSRDGPQPTRGLRAPGSTSRSLSPKDRGIRNYRLRDDASIPTRRSQNLSRESSCDHSREIARTLEDDNSDAQQGQVLGPIHQKSSRQERKRSLSPFSKRLAMTRGARQNR